MQLSPDAYLNGDYRDWPGDYEGDFDFLDGLLHRHDWGDALHSQVHAQLIGWFGDHEREWGVKTLASLTLRITPTRYRVPDISIFERGAEGSAPAADSIPLVVIEVLSPEDTVEHTASLMNDYLVLGVSNIWMIDPSQMLGWECSAKGFGWVSKFAVPGTEIAGDLAALDD